LHDPHKYILGLTYNVTMGSDNKQFYGLHKLVSLRTIDFNGISDAMAFVDSGKDAEYLKSVLKRMYSKRVENPEKAKYDFIVLKKI